MVRVEPLQRNPDPEEPEAPLVEAGIPDGRLVVAVVVNGAIPPRPAGRRQGPVPRRPRWLTPAPGCGPVPPRRAVEVAAVRIAAPGAARSARSTRATRATGVIEAGTARATRSARVIGRRSTRPTGAAGSARVTGSTRATGTTRAAGAARAPGSAWIVRSGRAVIRRGRAAVVTRGTRRLSRCGEGRTGAHAQGGGAKSADDRSPRNELLEFHSPSPNPKVST